MTPRSLSFLVLVSTAACGSGRVVPSDTEPAAPPPDATPAAAPAPAAAVAPTPAPQPATTAPPQAPAYVPYDAGALPIRRIGQWSTSGITTPARLVIRDDSTYARFWAGLSAGERPSVDFTRDVVIAAAAGQQATGGRSIVVERVTRAGQGLAVEVLETSPGPGCMVTQALTQPVDLVVVAAADARTWSFSDREQVQACQ